MKLYPNLVNAVLDGLDRIFTDQEYADKVIERLLKQDPRWGSRDRRFIAETIYDIVRWRRWLAAIAKTSENNLEAMVAVYLVWKFNELPGWNIFSDYQKEKIVSEIKSDSFPRKIRMSIPDWLDTLGELELGTRWPIELESLNNPAPVHLRVNTLKTDRQRLLKQLHEEGIEATALDHPSTAIELVERKNIFRSTAFQSGLFEVQDAASQQVALFLNPQQGERIVDACAGAGGKSLHLSSIMGNSGKIVAMDTAGWKLDELKKRARRAGSSNIETRIIEGTKTIKRLEHSADRLLLDVPCSGLGVLRRNPDAKWKLSMASIEETKNQQKEILNLYHRILKPGGTMVYATCSILPSENGFQVKNFLETNPNFILEEERSLFPSEGTDGFYMARLRKLN
ncbi:MAG: RsmB/NOP family class I SAM-dependent RNA methyltransferase [Bacteroidetes bacterium]|nr:RsmB/NOP family class I SAM-dependent RNA methyltransferase [Bacteroidota bacterium]